MTSTQMSGNKKKISISTRGYAKISEKQLDNGRADEKKARVDSYGAIAEQKKDNVAARAGHVTKGPRGDSIWRPTGALPQGGEPSEEMFAVRLAL